MNNTIKILYGTDVAPEVALEMVQIVIGEGRISTTTHGPSYCTVSRIGNLVIYAGRTKTMDTFQVWEWSTE